MALTSEFGNYLPSIAQAKTGTLAFFIVVIFGLVGMVSVMFLLYIAKFKIKVDVEERRGSNIVEYTTRGGIVKNRKTEVKEFWVWRDKWMPFNTLKAPLPPSDTYRITKKGNPILRIYKDSTDTFDIVPPTPPEEIQGTRIIKPLGIAQSPTPKDLDWFNWASQTLKGLAPKYRNDRGILRENAGLISFGAVLFVFLAGMVLMLDSWGEQTDNIARVSDNAVEIAKIEERITKNLQGKQVIEPAQGNANTGDT